ncbi:MAG: ABC transporter ATP-binding protein [Candidatus Faecenecus gallistercoris]|nr:ABC transporter ATP-binding protein [Bacillota bacterium]MDD7102954.1 ABC transporter ATP-binding protein [Bacillota bacterium]MDY4051514.1 ABC transporter ATP-binding protein [Candidatus Faecenecus gallistercoris]CDE08358.1 aBC transporter related protein [Bacillus sp. CAG:988]
MSVLEVKNLTKKFGKRVILDQVSVTLEEGEVVGLVGPNGAGKSTFIKSILGLYNIDEGDVKICGFDVYKQHRDALSKVGCIVENPDMYQNISGRKNLKICALMNDLPKNTDIDSVVHLVRMESRIDDKVKTYSLGMKQRLGLASALLNHPKLLILDEPINGLDPQGIMELRQIVRDLSKKDKMTVLISSHILAEIGQMCDRIIMIDQGKIVDSFTMDEIRAKNISLEEEYLSKASKDIR